MSQNHRVVYSTDPRDKIKCPRCHKLMAECICIPFEKADTTKFVANIRIEKSGRGGKTVTVLADMPKDEEFLKSLTKEIKNKCGTGGTYVLTRELACIEIQGDKREAIKKILQAKAIKFKGQ